MEIVAEEAVAPAPAAGGATEQPPAAAPAEHRVRFTATAGEYFRIWIVNLALTLATLGVFSAWAKVRAKRYFYGHTRVNGNAFDYRGRPIAILKGRILAVIVTAGVYGASHFAPMLLWVLLPLAVFGMPWLMVRSFAFNAHNSAFRGLRLRFDGTYWQCWRVMVGYGLLTAVTLGLAYYHLKAKLTEFIVRHHAFGTTRFDVGKLSRTFSKIYARMILMGLLGGILLAGSSGWLIAAGLRPESPQFLALNLVVYAYYLGLFAYVRARVLNATFNEATLGSVRFRSTLGARRLYAIYLTNIVAIVFTLGLATPWALVRTLRYRAENLVVIAPEGLGRFDAAAGAEVGAGGEEVGEMLDFDFSL